MKISIILHLFLFGVLLNTINHVNGCGMTTHNMVARRAYNFTNFNEYSQYEKYISDNFDVFDAGAAFPDFGYDCGGLANESEAAHWPPFLRAASKYLLETYPQPWSQDGIRLAVFLMGITSHQIADISWHSIGGIKEGLIRAMAGQDFNNTYSIAHSNADEGGEFELAYNYDLSWLSDKWYVPITDMKNIFHSMNYTKVNDENLLRCNSILYAGAMGVKIGGRFFYPEIAKKSPFLVDHYQDYFNGGLDDMSIWTSYCWPVLMGWMQGNPIGNFCLIQPDPDNNLLKDEIQKHHLLQQQYHSESQSKLQVINEQLSTSILQDMKIKKQGSGVTFSLPTKMEKLINQVLDKFKEQETKLEILLNDYLPKINNLFNKHQQQEEEEQVVEEQIEYQEEDESKYFNIKIIDNQKLNSKNANYIKSRKSIKPTNSKSIKIIQDKLSIETNNYTTIYGQNMYSYFGKDIRSKDLNGDSFEDLIISSPGYGLPGSMQSGCVYFIISNGTNNNDLASLVKNPNSMVDIDQIASDKICNTETHSKFGWNIDVLDFNLDGIMDIVIGAPSAFNEDLTYLGKVYIYLGQLNQTTSEWSYNEDYILMQGMTAHDTIGTVIRIADCNADSLPDLILGLPHSSGGGSQRGVVHIFYSSPSRLPGSNITMLESNVYLHGKVDYEWFGYEIKVTGSGDKSTLLIGSPNFHDISHVQVNIGKITAYPYNVNIGSFDHNPKFILIGVNKNDKLGYSFNMVNGSLFGINSVHDIMVLSLPTRGFGDDFDQVGEVVLIDIDSLYGIVPIKTVFPLLSIKGTTKFSRFGSSLLIGKLNINDQYASLFVGAPLWTDSIDTGSGCVFSFLPNQHIINDPMVQKQNRINNTPIVIYDSVHSIKTYKFSGGNGSGSSLNNKSKDSRFGFRILLSDFDNNGKTYLIVSADRDSSKLLEGGSINIFQ